MARSSSAQKIARLAERGKGKKVRFQGGSVFPTVILVVCLLGAVLIAAFDGVKLASDRMSIVLAFVADGTEVPMPIDAMALLPQAQPAE
ncbi:MAG: hypothetical protein EBY93_02670 [Actinobacteria bacterium]|nr:hypothetical protein [Actinomycetota bacterium]